MEAVRVIPTIDRTDPEQIARMEELGRASNMSADEMFEVYEQSMARDAHYIVDDMFQVVVIEHPTMGPFGMVQLSIQRRDGKEASWSDKQKIKNHFLGDEHEAVELYPSESRLMDTAPNYHLWAMRTLPRFPFGIERGRVVTPHAVGAVG